MKQLLCRTPMLNEAKENGKGHNWAVEILIFVLVFFIAQSLVSIPVTVGTMVWMFTSEEVIAALMEVMETGDMTSYMEVVETFTTQMPDWMMILQLFSTAIATATAIFYCRWIEKRSLASMGMRRPYFLREYGVGVLVGITLIAACVGICCISGSMKLHASSFSPLIWLLYLLGFLIQGMSEEVLCRGYMMVSVSRKNSLVLAVLTNSVIFGLLHLANPGFGLLPLLNIILFGIFESIYVLKRGNLWGACAIHSFWNFFQGNIFGISVSGTGAGASPLAATMTPGQELINGGTFGIEGGLVVSVVMTLAILVLLFLVPAKQQEPSDPIPEPQFS